MKQQPIKWNKRGRAVLFALNGMAEILTFTACFLGPIAIGVLLLK